MKTMAAFANYTASTIATSTYGVLHDPRTTTVSESVLQGNSFRCREYRGEHDWPKTTFGSRFRAIRRGTGI